MQEQAAERSLPQPVRLLLLDTCGAQAFVALATVDSGNAADEGAVVQSATLAGRDCSTRLLPVVRAMLQEAGWQPAGLAAVVVASGPGSFTGVRIGLSFAKGLVTAIGVPLIAISRLETLASMAERSAAVGVEGRKPGVSCAALDGGRGELYVRLSGRDGQVRELVATPEWLRTNAPDAAIYAGDAASESLLAGAVRVRAGEPDAVAMLPLAAGRLREADFDDPAFLDANYVRTTDGQIFAKPLARVDTPRAAIATQETQ